MAKAPATHFVVERLNWRRVEYSWGTAFYRLPGETRVGAFDDADAAEELRREQEERARRFVNPFPGAPGGLADLTDFAEPVWCDWLTDHDIEPPEPRPKDRFGWAAWWDTAAPGWSEAQRAAAWEKLHKAQFFRVVERSRRPVGYAVVKVQWDSDHAEGFSSGTEGGKVQKVYRSRPKAEAEWARLSTQEREFWTGVVQVAGWAEEDTGLNRFDPQDRVLPGQCPFEPPPKPARASDELDEYLVRFAPDEVPFAEVMEVELKGLPGAQEGGLYLVQRASLTGCGGGDGALPTFYVDYHSNRHSLVPVLGFPSRAEAEMARAELEQRAREVCLFALVFPPFHHPVVSKAVAPALQGLGLSLPDSLATTPEFDGAPPATWEEQLAHTKVMKKYRDAFAAWWAENAAAITPEKNADLWDRLLPDWEFYFVTEVPLED